MALVTLRINGNETMSIRQEIEVIPESLARPFARAHRSMQHDEQGRVWLRLVGQVGDPSTRPPAMLQRAALHVAS